jgi:DNA-binding transcriptional LysR family regulator
VGLSEPIRWISLHSYGWQLAMSANHALAGKQLITAGDLDGQRLLLYDREHYPDYWDRVTSFFKEHQIQAKIAGEFDGVSSLTAALEGNLGIALLAEGSRIDPRQRLVTRPLQAAPDRIDVAAGVAAENQTSAQVLAFIEELKHAAAEL